MAINEQAEIAKREARRKRRKSTQAISYIMAVVLIIILLGGITVGTIYGVNYWDLYQEEEAEQLLLEQQAAEQLEAEQLLLEQQAEEQLEEEEPQDEPEEEEVSLLNPLLEDFITSHLEDMTIEDKVAGLFMVTPEGLTGVRTAVAAGATTQTALANYPVGGIIYFSNNITSENQIKAMISNTISYSKYPLFIGVDEEGGTVSRLANANLGLEKTETMETIGQSGDLTLAQTAGTNIGQYLVEYGFNVNFAPVADVTTVEGNPLGDRSFGSDALLVAEMVTSYIEGLQSTGVSGTVKHFPGHGNTTQDSHNEVAITEKTLDELKDLEFIPFVSAIESGVNMVMVGHISAPSIIGDNTPSSLSSMMINEVLRNQLGYDGIVVTDALNMTAITSQYDSVEAVILALQAGVDILLMPEDFELSYNGVLEAVTSGKITEERIEESLRRIYRVKFAETFDE